PTLAESFLSVKLKEKKKRKKGITDGYGSLIGWITEKKRRRFGITGLFLIVFMSTFFLLPKVPMSIMPDIFDRYTEVLIELEPGVTPSEREEMALEMDKQLGMVKDVESNIVMDSVTMIAGLINMTPEEEQTMSQDKVNEEVMKRLEEMQEEYPISSVATTTDGAEQYPVQLQV